MGVNAKRILVNILATYGRSILSFVFTLFTARWILAALGKSDFGLYGVVGGVMFIVTIVNSTQSATVGRYYAHSIGSGGAEDSEDLMRWFNSAALIHITLPVIIAIVGYPIGVYCLEHWLNIPSDRVGACIWVFRFSLLSFFFSAISVPYSAMFVARQLISKLVLFSLVQVFGLVVISYSLLYISADRLIVYGGMLCVMNVSVHLLQIYFAHKQFKSCRIKKKMLLDKKRIGMVLGFTGMKSLGDVAWGIKINGSAFVVNLQFGPIANAAFSVANQLSNQAETFCRTLANAFAPAITTEEGAGNRVGMVDLSLNCCKFGTLLLLLFVIPLSVEVDYWLELWLRSPPEGCGPLCVCMLVSGVMTYLTKGHQLAIQANGEIAVWQIFDSLSYVAAVPLTILFVMIGFGLISVGYAYIVSMVLICSARLIFARKLLSMTFRQWVVEVLLPVSMVATISWFLAVICSLIIERGLLQLVAVTAVSMLSTVICAWMVAFKKSERELVVRHLVKIIK